MAGAAVVDEGPLEPDPAAAMPGRARLVFRK